MTEARSSEFSRRRKANFRKGIEIGIEEGRRMEREALAVQLAPIGFITPKAATLLKLGLACQTVQPCAEQDFTVPVFLGPVVQNEDIRTPIVTIEAPDTATEIKHQFYEDADRYGGSASGTKGNAE